MSQRYLGGIITANPTAPTLSNASGVWTLEQQFQYSSTWSPEIIGNSLRFRNSASAYLSRTPAAAGNLRQWTWSGWIKRGLIGSSQYPTLISATINASLNDSIYFTASTDTLTWNVSNSLVALTTTQVFRDPSAWYHIVLVWDTNNATAAYRARIYVNGVEVTSFSTDNRASIGSRDSAFNQVTTNYLGGSSNSALDFDGYMAEVYFIDGKVLTPSSFGAFDSNGVWQPLAYTGTYGTNGFYVDFSDNSAATAAALGKDYSGNGNNWTPNNISLTAGSTYDWMLDTPTPYADGGNGRGNYAVLNPLDKDGGNTAADGNLSVTTSTSGQGFQRATMFVNSGKWYWEVLVSSASGNSSIGIAGQNTTTSTSNYIGATADSYGYVATNGNKYNNGSSAAYGATYTTNDVIGVALDMDGGTLTFYKNGTTQGTAYTGLSGFFAPALSDVSNTLASVFVANFGQRPFTYTPPTGFKALNTQNLPVPSITNGAQYMAATTYTGNGTTYNLNNGANTTTGVSFKPDLIWQKNRSSAANNILVDSVRGGSLYLISNTTGADASAPGYMTFNSNGESFTSSDIATNQAGQSYIAWQWQAGQGTTSSNTNGSITSTVSANTTAGFSVVTYTGTGAAATVGHGLGVAPAMVITKARNTTNNWWTYHASLGGTKVSYLNLTNASAVDSSVWNSTAPTSSVFTVGSAFTSGTTYVAYCWSEVAGYSKFGSYTGNGSADGPFVYCGFRPRYVLIKRTDSSPYNWVIGDTSRNTYNVANAQLSANLSDAENTSYMLIDFVSNGFKLRTTDGAYNASGGTYIFAAFAENPFNISRAR